MQNYHVDRAVHAQREGRAASVFRTLIPSRNEVFRSIDPFLYLWGMATAYAYVVFLALPANLYFSARVYIGLGTLMWTFIAFLRHRNLPQMPIAIIGFIALQLWCVTTHIMMATNLGRGFPEVNMYLWFILEYMIPFFFIYYLCAVFPTAKRHVINFFLLYLAIGATLSLLQFVGVAPAIAFGRIFMWAELDVWGTLRTTGMARNPYHNALLMILGVSLVAGRWLARPPKLVDCVLLLLFFTAMIGTQSRASAPGMLVCIVVAIVLFSRHWKDINKPVFFTGAFGVAACLLLLMVAAGRQEANPLAYFTHDRLTTFRLDRHRTRQFDAVEDIYRYFPVTGIGSDQRTLNLQGRPKDKWGPYVVESLYVAFLAISGIPGVILLLASMFAAVASSSRVFFRHFKTDVYTSAAHVAVFCGVTTIIFQGGFHNAMTVHGVSSTMFLMGGLAAMSWRPKVKEGLVQPLPRSKWMVKPLPSRAPSRALAPRDGS